MRPLRFVLPLLLALALAACGGSDDGGGPLAGLGLPPTAPPSGAGSGNPPLSRPTSTPAPATTASGQPGVAGTNTSLPVNGRSAYNNVYYADISRVELTEREVRIYISAQGDFDLRQPETSCILEEDLPIQTRSMLYPTSFVATTSRPGAFTGYLTFLRGSLKPGAVYSFIYSCTQDYNPVRLPRFS